MSAAKGGKSSKAVVESKKAAPPAAPTLEDDDSLTSDGSDGGQSDDGAANGVGLTENQGRLLYMISLYTKPARTAADKEEWIRKQALMVLVYEAIVKKALDFDYAPASEIVEGRRVYFNTSQEGRSDIDYLREEGLLNGLKVSSKTYQPITCYQISDKGLEVVRRLPKADKDAIHEVVYKEMNVRNLTHPIWNSELCQYYMLPEGTTDFTDVTPSSVMRCESVSYVSSAYVPQCLRYSGRPTLSNAHRANESAVGATSLRDELDEVITLNSVSIIVAEFIPFGANQIVSMNTSLGSTERVQGGFFTAMVDHDSAGTKLDVAPGLTSINILDYSLTEHVNFEADIHEPEPDGVVQVETFGVSCNADGTCFYGMQIEALLDRVKDSISLDHLSRLLVDVHRDSSGIVDSVISAYQRQLLDLVFSGDARNRDKVNLLVANEITPHLSAESYMDKGEYENELKQVLGDTRAAFDISEHDTLIFGAHGILVAGPNSRHHEPLLCSYLQFSAVDLFMRNFYIRLFLLMDSMKQARRSIDDSVKDPNSLATIRQHMAVLSREVIMMDEILGYMTESLTTAEIPAEPTDQAGRSLFERLGIDHLAKQLLKRALDMRKTMDGVKHEHGVLSEMSNIVAENRMYDINESVAINTKTLCLLQEANEKSSNSLEILQVAIAGMLAFDVLDRITGSWSVMDTTWFASFANSMIKDTPIIWLFLNLLLWLFIAWFTMRVLKGRGYLAKGLITMRLQVKTKIFMSKLQEYMRSKNVALEDNVYAMRACVVKASWTETDKHNWGGHAPTIQLEYDEQNEYLHTITVQYNKRIAQRALALTSNELRERIVRLLSEAGVFPPSVDVQLLAGNIPAMSAKDV